MVPTVLPSGHLVRKCVSRVLARSWTSALKNSSWASESERASGSGNARAEINAYHRRRRSRRQKPRVPFRLEGPLCWTTATHSLKKRERERERERERPRRCVKGSRTVRRGGARDGGRRGKNDACNARYFHALTAEENNGYGRAPANATVKRLTSETSEQAARNAIPPPLVDDRSEGDGRLISHSSAKYDGNERHVGTKPE